MKLQPRERRGGTEGYGSRMIPPGSLGPAGQSAGSSPNLSATQANQGHLFTSQFLVGFHRFTQSSPLPLPAKLSCKLYPQAVSLMVKWLQQFQPLYLTARVPKGATPAIQ